MESIQIDISKVSEKYKIGISEFIKQYIESAYQKPKKIVGLVYENKKGKVEYRLMIS